MPFSLLETWTLPPDVLGMIDRPPEGYPLNPELVSKFESLGDNCEFGFVQRFHEAEPSSLFRWATAPLHGVMIGLEDSWHNIYSWESLRPWAYEMAWDDQYQCAFHCAVHCDRSAEDQPFEFVLPDAERRAVWESDRPKFLHLRDKTLSSLKNADKIFVVKANAGLSVEECRRLKAALDLHGEHRLLCVLPHGETDLRGIGLLENNLKIASISQLASYSRVELAAYGEWTSILQAAVDTPWKV